MVFVARPPAARCPDRLPSAWFISVCSGRNHRPIVAALSDRPPFYSVLSSPAAAVPEQSHQPAPRANLFRQLFFIRHFRWRGCGNNDTPIQLWRGWPGHPRARLGRRRICGLNCQRGSERTEVSAATQDWAVHKRDGYWHAECHENALSAHRDTW